MWLGLFQDSSFSGHVPLASLDSSRVTVLVKDNHGDIDMQTYFLKIHPLVIDNFNYDDSPLLHGWAATPFSGQVSTNLEPTLNERELIVTSSDGLEFGVDRDGRWFAHSLSVATRSSSDFSITLRVLDSSGTTIFLKYTTDDGPTKGVGNVISVHLGSRYRDGTWHSILRDLNYDILSVNWKSTIRQIIGFSIRGSVEIAGLVLGIPASRSDATRMSSIFGSYRLDQNYPNPFNSSTQIGYDIERPSRVSIIIYDILGRTVTALRRNAFGGKGHYLVTWYGDNDLGLVCPSGAYFFRFKAEPLDGSAPFISTKEMILLK